MPIDITAKKSNFISRSVIQANTLLSTITSLSQMLEEATVENYTNVITEDDFVGENNHIDKTVLIAFFSALTAILDLLKANNNANFKKLYDMKR